MKYVKLNKITLNAIFISGLLCIPVTNASVIKQSTSNICHDSSSPSYSRTKNFVPFDSIESCLADGGRLPKGSKHYPISSSTDDYKREFFGHGWLDTDRDCQNSRMETLISHSLTPVEFKSTSECLVLKGRWLSLFTGKTIYSAADIDIDHVVPLKWAWVHGANDWDKERRLGFANDPSNLIAVEASLNRQKGAKGPEEWLPPTNQCQYVLRFLRIVKAYDLKLTTLESNTIAKKKDRYCK